MNIHIETDRLFLRDIEDSDLEGMFLLDSDPEVHTYLGNKPITSKQEAQNNIDYIRNQYKENGIGRWAIIDKKTEDFIGWSGLKYETTLRPEIAYYDLGYRLRKEYWNKGIATETAIASLKYGFNQMNLNEICAAAEIGNLASNKILLKVGLKFIEQFKVDDDLCNWYSLTKKEWSSL